MHLKKQIYNALLYFVILANSLIHQKNSMRNEEFELLLQKASIGCCKKEELLEAKERLESHLEDVNAQCAEYEQVIHQKVNADIQHLCSR